MLSHYSNGTLKCTFCGYSNIVALSLDHVEGGGTKHKKEVCKGGFYEWIIRSNFPPGFQVLCMNCQFLKRHNRNENAHQQKKLKEISLTCYNSPVVDKVGNKE